MSGLWKFYKVRNLEWEAKSIHFTATTAAQNHYLEKYTKRYPEATVSLRVSSNCEYDERVYFYITLKFKCIEDEAAFIVKET